MLALNLLVSVTPMASLSAVPFHLHANIHLAANESSQDSRLGLGLEISYSHWDDRIDTILFKHQDLCHAECQQEDVNFIYPLTLLMTMSGLSCLF